MHKSQSLAESFRHALSGIAQTGSCGRNFIIQLCCAVLAVVLGFICQLSGAEWAAIIICIALVLGGECLNTAVEAAVDLMTDSYHPLAKRAKDCAAGGVLVFSLGSLVVGCVIFIPHLLALLG